jgi:hypothetical protein
MPVAPELSLGRFRGVAMSASESGDALSDVAVLRWTGYGLAALSVVVFLACIVLRAPSLAIVLLAIAVVSLVVVFRAPEAFETLGPGRGKGLNLTIPDSTTRGFNLLVGAPTFLLGFFAMGAQFEDYTVPIAGALVGAIVLLVVGMVALSRSVMDSPIWFLMVAFVMGAIIGYSALAIVNALFDGSPPVTLSAPVLDGYVNYSTRAPREPIGYHLHIAPYGARRGASWLSVSHDVYAAHQPGSEVCLIEHRGAVGLPWVVPCDY